MATLSQVSGKTGVRGGWHGAVGEQDTLVFYTPGATPATPTMMLAVPSANITGGGHMAILQALARLPMDFGLDFYDDFLSLDITGDVWTFVSIGGGAGVISGLGGILTMTNGAADNDSCQIQLDGESFVPTIGNDIWFEAQLSVSDADQCDMMCGLSITDATLTAAVGGPLQSTDFIGFSIDDAGGDGAIDFTTMAAAGATTTTDTGSVAADGTMVRLGFYVQDLTSVTPYINGVAAAAHAVVADIPALPLTPSFVIQNGEAVIKDMEIDWVRCIQIK